MALSLQEVFSETQKQKCLLIASVLTSLNYHKDATKSKHKSSHQIKVRLCISIFFFSYV